MEERCPSASSKHRTRITITLKVFGKMHMDIKGDQMQGQGDMSHHDAPRYIGHQIIIIYDVTETADAPHGGHKMDHGTGQVKHGTNNVIHGWVKALPRERFKRQLDTLSAGVVKVRSVFKATDGRTRGIELTATPYTANASAENISAEGNPGFESATGRLPPVKKICGRTSMPPERASTLRDTRQQARNGTRIVTSTVFYFQGAPNVGDECSKRVRYGMGKSYVCCEEVPVSDCVTGTITDVPACDRAKAESTCIVVTPQTSAKPVGKRSEVEGFLLTNYRKHRGDSPTGTLWSIMNLRATSPQRRRSAKKPPRGAQRRLSVGMPTSAGQSDITCVLKKLRLLTATRTLLCAAAFSMHYEGTQETATFGITCVTTHLPQAGRMVERQNLRRNPEESLWKLPVRPMPPSSADIFKIESPTQAKIVI